MMITRRQVMAIPFAWTASSLVASISRGAERTAPLREQLKNGLRATRPNELAFIDHVVGMVGSNKLSLRAVNQAFKWARERRPDYPFPYFERALRVLASREGVTI